jgi:NADPH:quinone reductase
VSEPVPASMTAIAIRAPGGPEVLQPRRQPVPDIGAGEVLIRVAAAGVNRPDLLQRQGKYPPPPGAPDTPGLEVAGTIVAVGASVSDWRVGDAVCALVAGGGYAEYCAAPAVQCLPVPRGLGLTEAAAVPETYFTVWTNVFERGRLQAGETLLVHGGASGIGTTAIALGRAFGATVYATAGTREKCAACERLGAVHAINYRTEDFVAVVRERTAGAGVNLVLDMVGGDYLGRNLEALAIEGRLVQIAFLRGARAEVNLAPVMQKRLTITGSTLRPRTPDEKGAIARALHVHVWPRIERGEVRPVIHTTFPLERASEAHAMLEAGEHVGKIVLVVGEPVVPSDAARHGPTSSTVMERERPVADRSTGRSLRQCRRTALTAAATPAPSARNGSARPRSDSIARV